MDLNYYIHDDLKSVWKRIKNCSRITEKDTLDSWIKIMEDGNLFKVTDETYSSIIMDELITEIEKEEDESLFSSDLTNEMFRVPIILKEPKGEMILLYGETHLKKMIDSEGSCKVWLISREWWRR